MKGVGSGTKTGVLCRRGNPQEARISWKPTRRGDGVSTPVGFGGLFCGLELVGDVVDKAFHFLAVQLDAALTDGIGDTFARIGALFGSKENTAGCTYGCAAQECGENAKTFHSGVVFRGEYCLVGARFCTAWCKRGPTLTLPCKTTALSRIETNCARYFS